MDTTDSESELVSLISQYHSLLDTTDSDSDSGSDSDSDSDSDSKLKLRFMSLVIQIIHLVSTMDLDSQPKPLSRLMWLVTQTITLFNSLDLQSQPKPLSKLISFITRLLNSLDLDSQPKPFSELISLISQNISLDDWECDSEVESLLDQSMELEPESESEPISLVNRLDRDSYFHFDEFDSLLNQSLALEPEPELISLVNQIVSVAVCINSKWEKLISLCPRVELQFEYEDGRFRVWGKVEKTSNSTLGCLPRKWKTFKLRGEEEDVTHFHCSNCNGENHKDHEEAPVEIKHPLHPKHSLQLVMNSFWGRTRECCCCDKELQEVFYYCSACDYAMNIACVEKPPGLSMDLKSESTLISLITQLISLKYTLDSDSDSDSEPQPEFISLITIIISRVSSLNLALQPKPESKLMSLITQTITLFNSMDLDSQPKPLSDLISIITQLVNSKDLDLKFKSLMVQTLELEPELELMSLIHQILCLVISMNPEWEKLISLSPQVEVKLGKDGIFHVREKVHKRSNNKWHCLPGNWETFKLMIEEANITYFRCSNCNGENHGEYEKAPVEIKHPLHPKHSLHLVLFNEEEETRKCYCCDKDLKGVFYYCPVCGFAMNIACVEKPPILSINQPKWHEHTLALFPSMAAFPCNLCALTHSSCPFYICPPCDFVAHQSCISLPRLIRISRHPHRLSFTHSFGKGDWFCGVCRKKINNDCGGYSCIKNGCSYAAHSKCATQSNVWDGKDLEGEPEEIEEEVEPPFVKISDGIIRHFCHEHHHLRLDENTGRDYDEDKVCHACITPIYFGNFYSCVECEYILHETCANLSRKTYHPIHAHMLTLVRTDLRMDFCSACRLLCNTGFFYECSKGEGCRFVLHVQCATISEPLVHGSHIHPLYLTSKPREKRECFVCKEPRRFSTNETFNCIEGGCDFALCFGCATIPEKVRYKHDKHMLTLSYGWKRTSNEKYWCEACEGKIDPEERFYMCGKNCCVTLHIKCLIGKDLYVKHLSSIWSEAEGFLPNNHHMTRPFCYSCKKRCPHKIVFQSRGSVHCSVECALPGFYEK